jgi:predicted MFS family arabinose efflux permease
MADKIKAEAAAKSGLVSQLAVTAPFTVAHFAHHLITALAVPLTTYIQPEFNLSYAQVGLLITAFSLPYGLSQLPAGWLADKVGRRMLIFLGISGVAVTGLLIGVSTTYVMLFVLMILMGIVGGGYHPSAPPLILATVKPENRARTMGFHMVGGSASHFLSPVIGGAIAAAWGWRASYIGIAVPAILFGIAFYLFLGRQGGIKDAELAMKKSEADVGEKKSNLTRVISLIFLSSYSQSIVIALISFIPLYMVSTYGVDKKMAANLVALIYSAGLWASPLGGWVADKFGKLKITLLICLVTGPLVYFLNIAPFGILTAIILLAIGVTIYVRSPVTEAYIVSQTSARQRSTVLGFYYMGHQEGSALITPLIGYFVDNFGFGASFTGAAIALTAVAVLFFIFFWRKGD